MRVEQANSDAPETDAPLRRASDRTPMGRIRGPIERAYGTGDYALAAKLIENDILTAWYGFTPNVFGEMLATLVREVGATDGLIGGMARFMGLADHDPSHGDGESHEPVGAGEDFNREAMMTSARGFALRLQGKPTEALDLSRQVQGRTGALRPVFEANHGFGLFVAVQHGITAMLAGQFAEALESFAQAQEHVLVPSLAFLTRDAYLRMGMIHAIYGDSMRAHELLGEARSIPRTESWAEAHLDASEALLVAIFEADEPEDALRMLSAIPQQAIGELWPFHLVTTQRLLVRLGRREDALSHLGLFESIPLPRRDGDGFSGSAIPLCSAMHLLANGDIAQARAGHERTDQTLAVCRLVGAQIELVAGRPREALRVLAGLQAETSELRMMEAWRLGTSAGAHQLLGEIDNCREALAAAMDLPGGVRPGELQWFTADVRRLAAEELAGWPSDEVLVGTGSFGEFESAEVLTTRELDVLRDMATGRSREEIAKAQFISVNTLKAHLRSVYRKLGVNSRAAAVLEAERRGII